MYPDYKKQGIGASKSFLSLEYDKFQHIVPHSWIKIFGNMSTNPVHTSKYRMILYLNFSDKWFFDIEWTVNNFSHDNETLLHNISATSTFSPVNNSL